MRIDAHTHGMHAEKDETGKYVLPIVPIWKPGDSMDGINATRALGVEKIVLLDPPHVAFELAENLPDFCIPVPQVVMEESSPEEIDELFSRGARGIKFIAPMRSYGDNGYFPLYEAVRDNGGAAVFHTGFLSHGFFHPGHMLGRSDYVDIADMRPAAIDRICRAFPDLKVLMSHFGNPWWEETWTVMKSNKNVYADLSGGTACKKAMTMWKEMFAPDGKLDEASVGKLCFASDGCALIADGGLGRHVEHHDRLYDALGLPEALRRKIDWDNAAMLFGV